MGGQIIIQTVDIRVSSIFGNNFVVVLGQCISNILLHKSNFNLGNSVFQFA